MISFLFILLVTTASAVFFIYNNKKLILLKQQLMLTNSQNNTLQKKLSNYSYRKNIEIKFLQPTNKGGIINKDSSVLISPIDNSPVLHKSNMKMEVYIIDKAEYSNNIWYYVALPLENNINSRGWVKENDFSIFYDDSTSISKKNY